jgi:hypothetical protein
MATFDFEEIVDLAYCPTLKHAGYELCDCVKSDTAVADTDSDHSARFSNSCGQPVTMYIFFRIEHITAIHSFHWIHWLQAFDLE